MKFKDKTRFCDKIVRYFNKVDRPTYAGEIALELGCSLQNTEDCLDDLVFDGVLRVASAEEVKLIGGRSDSKVFVLVSSASLSLGTLA